VIISLTAVLTNTVAAEALVVRSRVKIAEIES
jgi:hypothetical protein